jgi:Tol biopolymer transport system component
MRTDGRDVRRVVDPWPDGAGFATDPNVSPDGETLSYVGFDGSLVGPPPASEPAQGLFTTDLDDSDDEDDDDTSAGIHQLLPFSDDLAIKQDWSPDGRRLLAGVNANFLHAGDSANIVTLRPDGSGLRYLTHYTGGEVNAFAGSYSPDGRWIVFRIEDHGRFGLFRMRTDGSDLRQILPFSDFRPRGNDWGPRPDDSDDDD